MIFKEFTNSDAYDLINDLQRVEDNIALLQKQVKASLGKDVLITPYSKGAWSREDFVKTSEIERVRTNLEALCQAIEEDYEIPPLKVKMQADDANSLEQGLKFIYDYIRDVIAIISQPLAGFYFANMPIVLMTTTSEGGG